MAMIITTEMTSRDAIDVVWYGLVNSSICDFE